MPTSDTGSKNKSPTCWIIICPVSLCQQGGCIIGDSGKSRKNNGPKNPAHLHATLVRYRCPQSSKRNKFRKTVLPDQGQGPMARVTTIAFFLPRYPSAYVDDRICNQVVWSSVMKARQCRNCMQLRNEWQDHTCAIDQPRDSTPEPMTAVIMCATAVHTVPA